MPPEPRLPSRREMFERRCYLLGLTDPGEVGRQWAAREAGREGGHRGG